MKNASGAFTTFAFPGAPMTQAFGINDHGVVAGAYPIGSGSSAQSFGFTWRRGHGFTTISDPHGIGSTVINGINNSGERHGRIVIRNGDISASSRSFLSPYCV